jgi:WD40 repeat protein
VKRPDVDSLLKDYDYLPDEKEIELLRGAIRLSINALVKDKTQLAGQLLGRFLCFYENGIQSLLSQASGYRDDIRLLPITSFLKSPGGPLIRTLEGHDVWVNAVAITPDGKYAVSAANDKTLKVWDLEQGVIVSNFTGDSSFQTCYISPYGESIVADDFLGKMHFFSFEKSD